MWAVTCRGSIVHEARALPGQAEDSVPGAQTGPKDQVQKGRVPRVVRI